MVVFSMNQARNLLCILFTFTAKLKGTGASTLFDDGNNNDEQKKGETDKKKKWEPSRGADENSTKTTRLVVRNLSFKV